MSYCDPPNRFSSTNQPTRRRGPSVVKYLRKLLEKKITYEDPETKEMVKGKIALVIALRAVLNACQGDQDAIEDIIDRIDGKTAQKLIGEGFSTSVGITLITPKEREGQLADRANALAI